MKALKEESGFTLMELLVTINVAFILITLVTSVFLFSTGFFNTIIKKSEKESEAYNYINYLDSRLTKAQFFTVNSANDEIYFAFGKEDTLFVNSKRDNPFLFNEFVGIKISIKTFSGEEQELNSETLSIREENKSISSQSIMRMELLYKFKSREYRLNFSNSLVSMKKVKNLL